MHIKLLKTFQTEDVRFVTKHLYRYTKCLLLEVNNFDFP